MTALPASPSVWQPTRWPQQALLGAIWVYQHTLSPALPPSCRYEPSCSRYAATAIARHGALAGSWLAIRRLARCQPWGGHGYDPVP
jgi:putative membrane protein insertion efficiency factor